MPERPPGYDPSRLARLFDESARRGGAQPPDGWGPGIPGLVARRAFEALDLGPEDVLLDVGTGTGRLALRAAPLCRRVIGIDLSPESLRRADSAAHEAGWRYVQFALGTFEDPCAQLDLEPLGITRILAVYALHHLPPDLQEHCLPRLARLLRRPGRIAIGDLLAFEPPDRHCDAWDEVHCDGGDTDFPADPERLSQALERLGAEVTLERLHPLAGVLLATFAQPRTA